MSINNAQVPTCNTQFSELSLLLCIFFFRNTGGVNCKPIKYLLRKRYYNICCVKKFVIYMPKEIFLKITFFFMKYCVCGVPIGIIYYIAEIIVMVVPNIVIKS